MKPVSRQLRSLVKPKKLIQLTKEVEVLNSLPLSASLVRRAEDVGEDTTGQGATEDAVSLNGRLVQATSLGVTAVLAVVLATRGTLGSNAEGEGESSDNSDEVHCEKVMVV